MIEATDYRPEPEKNYNYSSITTKIEEAIEHLQKLLESAKKEDLTERWFTR